MNISLFICTAVLATAPQESVRAYFHRLSERDVKRNDEYIRSVQKEINESKNYKYPEGKDGASFGMKAGDTLVRPLMTFPGRVVENVGAAIAIGPELAWNAVDKKIDEIRGTVETGWRAKKTKLTTGDKVSLGLLRAAKAVTAVPYAVGTGLLIGGNTYNGGIGLGSATLATMAGGAIGGAVGETFGGNRKTST